MLAIVPFISIQSRDESVFCPVPKSLGSTCLETYFGIKQGGIWWYMGILCPTICHTKATYIREISILVWGEDSFDGVVVKIRGVLSDIPMADNDQGYHIDQPQKESRYKLEHFVLLLQYLLIIGYLGFPSTRG